MNFFNDFLEYIFLPCCGVCEKIGEGYLCEKCEKELKKYLINCKDKNIYHVFKYQDIIRNLLLKYKFDDKSFIYKTFCEFIVKNEKIFDFIKRYDIIIPVPIHKKRMKERGYNQSELIARDLAKKANIACYTDVLIKIKNNKAQSTLNSKQRNENTKNVYKLFKQEKIDKKNILLFDDIYTTGATMNSCVQELKKSKVKQIGILTLAKD